MRFSFVTLIASLLFSLQHARAETSETISNPGFEEAGSAWNLVPRNQTPEAQGNNVLEITPDAQSPQGKGNQGLHIRVDEGSQIPPLVVQTLQSPTSLPFRLKFAFRINDQTTYSGGDGVLILRLMTVNGKENTLVFSGNGAFRFGKQSANEPNGTFDRDVWNSVEVVLPESGSTKPAEVTITPETGSPSKIAITDWGTFDAEDQVDKIQIQPGFAARPITDVYVDDISISK